MALSIKHLRHTLSPPDPSVDGQIGRPALDPTPEQRQLVEVLSAIGASQEAICRELVRLGVPCASRNTLRHAFSEELDHGKERRLLAYGVKIHRIAMGDSPAALSAAKFLLGVLGGPQWRMPKDEPDMPGGGGESDGETVHIYMPPNHRDEPEPDDDGPIIEGNAEAA